MDLAEFDDLIDNYRDAQVDGGFHARYRARGALKDAFRALEAERDALRKSVGQWSDTLKEVHESVCETLGIEGDDSLPELVAEWAEGEYAAVREDAGRYRAWRTAICNERWDLLDDIERYIDDAKIDPPTIPFVDGAVDIAVAKLATEAKA